MGKKKRVVLDTNVIISGFLWKGNENKVLEYCLNDKFHLLTSDFILREVRRVLSNKFHLEPRRIQRYTEELTKVSTILQTAGIITILKDDPSDNFIIETAILGNADLIVTGDKHLLKLERYENITILNASSIIDLTSGS